MAKNQEMFFFIADISGYTAYMIKNNTASEHAKRMLTLLIQSIVKQVEFPLEIYKLEGDAILLYLPRPVKDKLWITKKIFSFFQAFEKKLLEIKESTFCTCGACQNIEKLELKVIAHSGEASLQKIGRFKELTGVDIIIIHRLLKNHVPLHRYLLLTESAYQRMLIPENIKISKSSETYAEIGTLPIYVCEPPPLNTEDIPPPATILDKGLHWLSMHFGKKSAADYRNLPNVDTTKNIK